MSITMLEWNINLATNYNGKSTIPGFVAEEILKADKDIFVLTEFAFTKNKDDFLDAISGKYRLTGTQHKVKGQNEVLIGWRKSRFDSDGSWDEYKPSPDLPDMARVKLTDKETGEQFNVAGARIKIVEYNTRRLQFRKILNYPKMHFEEYENWIIAADCNCLRADYKGQDFEKVWGMGIMNKITSEKKFKRHSPSGGESSIYKKYNFPVFKEDHFFTKGDIKCLNVEYSREFTKAHPDIYIHGEDFNHGWNNNTNKPEWSIPCGSGNPDHAMLFGEFIIDAG